MKAIKRNRLDYKIWLEIVKYPKNRILKLLLKATDHYGFILPRPGSPLIEGDVFQHAHDSVELLILKVQC